ncbi:MAG: hypothetical protein JXB07_20000 [Anaerolineae bacterium]|nr:hypothetical protein [Anaerolineae bacterium]
MINHDIECPQCGAVVYYELDRCPECGLDFYPPDDEEEESWKPTRSRGWGRSLIAVIGGWLVAGIAALILFFRFSLIDAQTTDWTMVGLMFITVSAFMGGYIVVAITRHSPIRHGILVSLLVIVDAVLIEALWRVVTIDTLVRPLTLLAWGLIIAGGMAGAVTSMQLQQRAGHAHPQASREDDLYRDLLARVRHDRAVAERLIAFESRQNTAAARSELIKSAITRWERDNR